MDSLLIPEEMRGEVEYFSNGRTIKGRFRLAVEARNNGNNNIL